MTQTSEDIWSIIHRCPSCGEYLQIAPEHAGRSGKCNHCGGAIHVPEILRRPLSRTLALVAASFVAGMLVIGLPLLAYHYLYGGAVDAPLLGSSPDSAPEERQASTLDDLPIRVAKVPNYQSPQTPAPPPARSANPVSAPTPTSEELLGDEKKLREAEEFAAARAAALQERQRRQAVQMQLQQNRMWIRQREQARAAEERATIIAQNEAALNQYQEFTRVSNEMVARNSEQTRYGGRYDAGWRPPVYYPSGRQGFDNSFRYSAATYYLSNGMPFSTTLFVQQMRQEQNDLRWDQFIDALSRR